MKEVLTYYEDLAPHYDVDRFDNSYGRFVDLAERNILDKWMQNVPPNQCIDIGCGTGRLLDYADFGMDISANMLAIAQHKYPNKYLFVNPANNTGLTSNQVENALCFHVFMHLSMEDVQQVLDEVHRILKPNGCFIFDFPSRHRRSIISRTKSDWHGSTAVTLNELNDLLQDKWHIQAYRGILFLPIHRLPKFMRPAVQWLDSALCRSFLKKYASYLIFNIRKL